MGTPFAKRGALDRFLITGEVLARAEQLVDEASNWYVDAVIDGIEDSLRAEGVPYGNFIEQQRAKARRRHEKESANVRRAMDVLASLPAE